MKTNKYKVYNFQRGKKGYFGGKFQVSVST